MNFHWKNYRILIPSLLIVGLLLFGLGRWIYYANKNDIHIAIVGPMTGTSSANGLSYVQGVKLFTEKINQSGGIDGKHIVLNIYDDQNKADLAKAKAEELVKKNRVLAVIGHNSSDCSIAAGEIYKTAEIPAITPASTNVKVTVGNEWYFRTIFNDNSQGRFLANYVKKILKYSEVKIVHEELRYGKYLTEVFEATAKEIGLKITYKKEFSTVSPTKEKDLENIVKELKAKNDNQLIFIPMHVPEGAVFVRLLKDHGLNNPVIAPDAFASAGFIEELKKQKREQLNPGFYSNEMLVTTPLIFDNANQKAQQFRDEYMLAYGKEPDWRAVYAYDSVMILVEAIRKTEINGSKSAIKEERKKIKEFLQGIDSPSEGIEGATGLNYFDENGDSPKPVSIGSYKNNEIISNLTQLQAVRDPSEILNPEKAIKEERMLLVDNKYLYKTNVVYTGIEINEIKDLDIGKQTYFMDFYLWFRYTGNIDPENIEFLNSEKPIALGKPIDQDPSEKMSYKVYHVKGKFKAETLPVKYVLEQNSLGISFRHKTLNRNNLIYVIDEIGIGKHIKKETLKNSQVLSSSYGWTIANTWAFQDTLKKNSLGSPRYLSLQDTTVPYSRFNMGIRIKKNEITHRRILPGVITMYIFLFCLAGIMVVGIISSLKSYKSFTNYFWTAQIILTFLMINSAEVETIEYLVDRDNIDKIKLVLNIFDLIWWIVPAIVLTQAIERFLWRPLEIKTEHKIPTVVRRFLNFLIYLLTFFGIVAFVYDQKITSLLATSGVVAMIIGLAIQVNIANVFSGIAINMERPFRVGDWIKIGTMDEGRVVDITWRTTRIRLRNQVMVSVPNSMASEAAII
ncbi:MAG TPA: ABC transporter substrate-binding protein, partial [Leptospiraceae bacterium]|nr:ABC transporter substrate-binding protein [Leptospiraceae bacterium]